MTEDTKKPAKAKRKNSLNAELRKLIESKTVGGKPLTQQQFANKSGLSPTSVGNICRGDRTWINVTTLKKIAKFCGLSPEQIGRLVLLAAD